MRHVLTGLVAIAGILVGGIGLAVWDVGRSGQWTWERLGAWDDPHAQVVEIALNDGGEVVVPKHADSDRFVMEPAWVMATGTYVHAGFRWRWLAGDVDEGCRVVSWSTITAPHVDVVPGLCSTERSERAVEDALWDVLVRDRVFAAMLRGDIIAENVHGLWWRRDDPILANWQEIEPNAEWVRQAGQPSWLAWPLDVQPASLPLPPVP